MPFNWIADHLQQKQNDGYLRHRTPIEYEKDGIICVAGQHYLNFASNDYLGMRQHEGLLQCWVEGLAQFGGGSGASPLVTGYSQAHQALEAYLAEQLNREAVLLFNSGFAANQAICQALFPDSGLSSGSGLSSRSELSSRSGLSSGSGLLLADKYMHASFIDGAMGCSGQLKRFRHNDLAHLSRLLTDHATGDNTCDTLVATESIFSMDGDTAPLPELVALCKQHQSWLMVDDAHGFGVLGETGLGCAEQYQLSQADVPVLMGTFGKAIGTGGAFVAGSQDLIDYLLNSAREYIYSTAMPPAQALASLFSLQHIATSEQRSTLQQNIAAFRQQAARQGLGLSSSESAIQPIQAGSPKAALKMSEGLKARGIWVPTIRYPTVPKGTDRLRITLSAHHTQQDISALCDALALARDEAGRDV